MSIKKSVKAIVILMLSALMTSCIAYRPQVAEMPLIHEKGELQMNGSVGLSAPFGDAYVGTTASYGATDWLSVQGHVNWNGSKGAYGQAAVGPRTESRTLRRHQRHLYALHHQYGNHLRL